MYNSQNVAERIKELAQKKNISVKQVLSDIGLGFNTMSNMKTSMPKSDNLAKIADYLDCSVDYLLGRTDDPKITGSTYINSNNNSVNQAINGNINLSAHSAEQDDEQLLALIKNLDLVDRSKIILHIDELKNKK